MTLKAAKPPEPWPDEGRDLLVHSQTHCIDSPFKESLIGKRIMCRWLAYSGNPIQMETVLFRPRHSLIDQSLRSRLGGETTTNGDGLFMGC